MNRKPLLATLLGIMIVSTMAFTMGGWALITVEDVPDYLEAGKPTKIAFKVRQHGVSPLEDLTPKVTLSSGGTKKSSVIAVNSKDPNGRYVATLTPPHAGEWTVNIHSGFGPSELTLMPVSAIAAGAVSPAALSDAERGQRLFYAKGCVTCHVRGDDGKNGFNVKAGPELTSRQYAASNLSKFLANPSTHPLSAVASPQGRMPNLELKEREIASLVAFINSEKKLSGR